MGDATDYYEDDNGYYLRPNGCHPDRWIECVKNGVLCRGKWCLNPVETVDKVSGQPMCPHKPQAIYLEVWIKRQKAEKEFEKEYRHQWI